MAFRRGGKDVLLLCVHQHLADWIGERIRGDERADTRDPAEGYFYIFYDEKRCIDLPDKGRRRLN